MYTQFQQRIHNTTTDLLNVQHVRILHMPNRRLDAMLPFSLSPVWCIQSIVLRMKDGLTVNGQ